MSKVRVHTSVSADGYVAGPNQSEENPLTLSDTTFTFVGGARLFEGIGPGLALEQVRAIEAPGVTHGKYRVGA